MMKLDKIQVLLLDKVSEGRVTPLIGQRKALADEIAEVEKRLEARKASSWLARAMSSRSNHRDAALLKEKRERIALLTCELVRTVAEIRASDEWHRIEDKLHGTGRVEKAAAEKPGALPAAKPARPRQAASSPGVRRPPVTGISRPRLSCLTGRPSGTPVDGLFNPRPRPDPLAGPPSARTTGKVYLPIPESLVAKAVAAGAIVGPRGGVYVPADANLAPLEAFLPFYARALIEPIHVELIPASSFGGSLSGLLTGSSWDGIRNRSLARTGGLCMLCGMNAIGAKTNDAHEIWEYYRHPGGQAVQKLVGILPVCRECHEPFHLGHANVRNRGDVAMARLAWINRWSDKEVQDFARFAFATWQERSTVEWHLDLGHVAALGPLVLKGAVTIGADGNITHPGGENGEAVTRILGVAFRQGKGDVHEALPAPDYGRLARDF